MTAPRLEIELEAVRHNATVLVDRLGRRGIRVVGVTKAVMAWPELAGVLAKAGVAGLGDSRLENLEKLRRDGNTLPLMMIRSPMLSQVDAAVHACDVSLNTELAVLHALSAAATRYKRPHAVVLMVELGDLREGIAIDEVVDMARCVTHLPGLVLAGIGTNLACQSGVVPDQNKMDELSGLADEVEAACGLTLDTVSGGNSANLGWALSSADVGRVNQLRLGEAILLGVDPLTRMPIDGLRQDAFRLFAEVIEVRTKPARPWGEIGQTAFGPAAPAPAPVGNGRSATETRRRAILAIGRQDIDPDGITAPAGVIIQGASSDHLVVDVTDASEVGDQVLMVGDELSFGLEYGALLRAATSPFVAKVARIVQPR
jgi:predicted amino acid racemase